MTSEGMDRHGLRPRDDGAGSISAYGIGSDTAGFPWTRSVIANPSTGSGQAAVTQSMTSGCMDCRASLAVTQITPSLRGT